MTPLVESLNRWAGAWAGLAWAVTWQSTLLVGAFSLLALGMKRASPGLRYWLWQIAAIKLLIMPFWGVSILLPATEPRNTNARSTPRPPARSGGNDDVRPEDWPHTLGRDVTAMDRPNETQDGWLGAVPVDWPAWLLMGWGLAIAGQVAAIARQRERLKRVLRRSEPANDPALLALVAELSRRIGLSGPPEVRIADGVGSPFVCGPRRPTLVLPGALAGSFGSEPLHAVLLHELAHLQRRDLLWDWIPAIARLLYFFHPAAHYIASRARLERELACDQAAMVLTGQSAANYAATLVEVVSRLSLTAPSSAPRGALASARLDGSAPGLAPGRASGIARS